MQVRLRFEGVAGNPLRRSCVSKARNAGEITKIVCLEGCLLEWVIFIGFMAPRAGKIFALLGMSRVKRSFWKSIFSLFGNVSCKTLVLEVQILTFCECLV